MTTHTPIKDTISAVYGGDAYEATCANCNKTIVEWRYLDRDDDRVRSVFEPWAVEVAVPTSPTTSRIKRVTECA